MSSVTDIGARVDQVQIFIIWMMVFWFVACNAVLVYFMFKYRRKSPDQKVVPLKGNHTLEVTWTVIPTILVLIIFYYGVIVWHDLRTPPDDAMDIQVRGQKWSWAFEYPELNRPSTAGTLYVPVSTNVKLTMKSNDVLHSLFIPEFRTKEDVVPSMYTQLWFNANKTGIYNIFCTEYCGKDHAVMYGKVHVLTLEEWERFVADKPIDGSRELTPLEKGEKLFTDRGCAGCHSVDGSTNVGPTFKNIFGREEEVLDTAGSALTITVDENYLTESINYPKAKVVKGYDPNQMPSFAGQLSDEQISNLITYIKTLKD